VPENELGRLPTDHNSLARLAFFLFYNLLLLFVVGPTRECFCFSVTAITVGENLLLVID